MYFHPSESETSPNRTPPNLWTTVEVSVGLVAACLPPCGPLIRRAPSLKVFTSKLSGFTWRSSRSSRNNSKFTKRLSSEDNISKIKGSTSRSDSAGEDAYELAQIRKQNTYVGEVV